jgi:hypothetical protein
MHTISFDLDGTLLCGRLTRLADPELPPLPQTVREDRLRRGAAPLLRQLAKDGHGIWIYTESLRGRTPVLEWFAALGIPFAGMVNRQIHEAEWLRRGFPPKCPRKYPPWFGIDLHVDNDPEIAAEGDALGYRVVPIDSGAEDFAQTVREGLFDAL